MWGIQPASLTERRFPSCRAVGTFSSILVEPAHFNFRRREQSSKYSSSSCCWVKLIVWYLRHTDTRDPIVCPIEIDKQLQKKQKSPREYCELLTMHSYCSISSPACSPGKHMVKHNELQFSLSFKKFKRLTPTSRRNLWELNKGRVLGVNCLGLVLCACSPDVWNVCVCIRYKQLETWRGFLIEMCSFFNICIYKWSLVCSETCLNYRKMKYWTSVWIWLFILFVYSKAGGGRGNNGNLIGQMLSVRTIPHF